MAILRVGFPYIRRIHTAYIRWVLHFRYLKCLVIYRYPVSPTNNKTLLVVIAILGRVSHRKVYHMYEYERKKHLKSLSKLSKPDNPPKEVANFASDFKLYRTPTKSHFHAWQIADIPFWLVHSLKIASMASSRGPFGSEFLCFSDFSALNIENLMQIPIAFHYTVWFIGCLISWLTIIPTLLG